MHAAESWRGEERKNLKEEVFILAHSFRGFNPWCTGWIALGLRRGRSHMVEGGRATIPEQAASFFFPFHTIWAPRLQDSAHTLRAGLPT
jgi:hypothetical protein